MRRRIFLLTGVMGIAFLSTVALGQSNWPQFRGADSSGVAAEAKIPDTWSTSKNVVWQTEIPGKGWSSPIVWDDKIIVTSAIAEEPASEPRKGLYIQGMQGRRGEGEHRWMVYCLDWETGKILWEKTAHQGVPRVPIHGKNSYATETPATDGERIVACFGAVGLFAYDMNGRELWSHEWEALPMRMGWGSAASPVIHEDRVYVLNDNEQSSFLAAFDKRTGRQIWRTKREEKSSWSSPFIWKNAQRTEIITAGESKVRSYDLEGQPLWELEGMSSITIPTPVAAKEMLYVASGYVADSYRPVYAILPARRAISR